MPAPTIEARPFTFLSTTLIQGDRPIQATEILVNGSPNGVSYPIVGRWQRQVPLFYGLNDFTAQATNGFATSTIVSASVFRIMPGDVNVDRVVNDIDLSLFTRAWNKYTIFADFNEDGKIDDKDLSLLASHWGQRY